MYNQINESSKEHSSDNNHNINLKDFIEEFEILCKSYINKNKNWHNKNSELEIIKKFAKEQELVVTKSDKGNGIVSLDKSMYYTKEYQYFSDKIFSKSNDDNDKEYKFLKKYLGIKKFRLN